MNNEKIKPSIIPASSNQLVVGSRLIRRAEAARILAISVSTLRRNEDQFQHTVNDDGVHLFKEADIRKAAATLSRKKALSDMGAAAGDLAADIFELFDNKVHAIDIVKNLRVTPDFVLALQDQWAQMHGGFMVSKKDAFRLGFISNKCEPRTAAEALLHLERYILQLKQSKQGTAQCQQCKQPAATLCEPCIVDWRGPLHSYRVGLETRTTEQGNEELRAFAEVAWCDSVDANDSRAAILHSKWYARAGVRKSEIADIVAAIEERNAVCADAERARR